MNNDEVKKTKLGMGLNGLLKMQNFNSQKDFNAQSNGEIDINLITANPNQPRKMFNSQEIMDLADSIRQHGLLQPIVLYKTEDENEEQIYIVVAGERRYRACKMLGMSKIPAIIKDKNNDEQSLAFASIIENIQRSDLLPIEEADYYLALKNEFNLTQGEIAQKIAKPRSHVANMMRIAESDEEFKAIASENKVPAGILKIICSRENAMELLNIVIDKHLSVRQLEQYLFSGELPGEYENASVKKTPNTIQKNQEMKQKLESIQADIFNITGMHLNFKYQNNLKNITISVGDEDQLSNVVNLLCGNGKQD